MDNEEQDDLKIARLRKLNENAVYLPYTCLSPNLSFGELRIFKLDDNTSGFFPNDTYGRKYNTSSRWPYDDDEFIPITNKSILEVNGQTFVFGKHTFTIKLSPDDYDGVFKKIFKAGSNILNLSDRFNWPGMLASASLATNRPLNFSYSIKGKNLYISQHDSDASCLLDMAKQVSWLRGDDIRPSLFVPPLEKAFFGVFDRGGFPKLSLTYSENFKNIKDSSTGIFFSLDDPPGTPINNRIAKIKEKATLKAVEKLKQEYQLISAHKIASSYKLDNLEGVINYKITKSHLLSYKTAKEKRTKTFRKAFCFTLLASAIGASLLKFWPNISQIASSILPF